MHLAAINRNKVFTKYGLVLLLGLWMSCCWTPAGLCADSESAPPCLWKNAGRELLDVAASPAQGTWAGYVLAAGFAGGLAAAFPHDVEWYQDVQSRRSAWQDKTMPVLTLMGDGWVHVGGYAALYQFGSADDRRVAAMAVEGQIDVAVIAFLTKFIFSAARPGDDPSQRTWFHFPSWDASFPSGHSMTSFCAAAILGRSYHCEWLTYPLAGMIAYSRVYNQAHWPTDVIAGAGLGLLIGQTVLAFHAREEAIAPSVHFSLLPEADGTGVMVTWAF